MDIDFFDHDDAPVPPDEVRIRELIARPHPDGLRIRVYLELTPFQERPNAEVIIRDSQGETVASVSVIETIDPKMEFTMHLRESQPVGEYTVDAIVYYSQIDADALADQEVTPIQADEQQVDRAGTTFRIKTDR